MSHLHPGYANRPRCSHDYDPRYSAPDVCAQCELERKKVTTMSELKNRDDIAAYVHERMKNEIAEFDRTMAVVDEAIRIERERCLRWALRVSGDCPHDDLVRSGAWISCGHAIEQKIGSGEFPQAE